MHGIEDIYTRYQHYHTLAIVAVIVSLVVSFLLLANWFVIYVMDDPLSEEKDEFAHKLDTILITCLLVVAPISFAIFYYHECLYKEIVTACSKNDHELCKSVPMRNKVGRKAC